jgi:hypothetical protein
MGEAAFPANFPVADKEISPSKSLSGAALVAAGKEDGLGTKAVVEANAEGAGASSLCLQPPAGNSATSDRTEAIRFILVTIADNSLEHQMWHSSALDCLSAPDRRAPFDQGNC